MQSKMTEREFRRAFHLEVAGHGEDAAVALAVRAGLEFAPEPVKLPERLELRWDGKVGWREDGTPWVAWEPTEQNCAPVDPAKISEAALLRFNAYPGLRAAAEEMTRRIRDFLSPGFQSFIRDSLLGLEAELTKGPK